MDKHQPDERVKTYQSPTVSTLNTFLFFAISSKHRYNVSSSVKTDAGSRTLDHAVKPSFGGRGDKQK